MPGFYLLLLCSSGSLETHQQAVLPQDPLICLFLVKFFWQNWFWFCWSTPGPVQRVQEAETTCVGSSGGTQQALTWRKALDCGCCSNSLSLSPTHLTPRHELNCELNSILLLMARGVPAWEYLKWKQAPSSLTHGNRDLVVTVDSRSLLWSVN